jgi:hypothetical protein
MSDLGLEFGASLVLGVWDLEFPESLGRLVIGHSIRPIRPIRPILNCLPIHFQNGALATHGDPEKPKGEGWRTKVARIFKR